MEIINLDTLKQEDLMEKLEQSFATVMKVDAKAIDVSLLFETKIGYKLASDVSEDKLKAVMSQNAGVAKDAVTVMSRSSRRLTSGEVDIVIKAEYLPTIDQTKALVNIAEMAKVL